MGETFGISLLPHSSWGGFKMFRRRWFAHLEDTRMHPLLLIDEAQELLPSVFAEIRLLASTDFDSRAILSVVFVGDNRLNDRLRRQDLQPIASRVRQHLVMDAAEPEDMAGSLDHLLEACHSRGLLYADDRLNAVFICRDDNRQPTGAEILGTATISARPESGASPSRCVITAMILCFMVQAVDCLTPRRRANSTDETPFFAVTIRWMAANQMVSGSLVHGS